MCVTKLRLWCGYGDKFFFCHFECMNMTLVMMIEFNNNLTVLVCMRAQHNHSQRDFVFFRWFFFEFLFIFSFRPVCQYPSQLLNIPVDIQFQRIQLNFLEPWNHVHQMIVSILIPHKLNSFHPKSENVNQK